MENNFIQMATSAGHAVAYTISSTFKHIKIVWLVGVTLIFDGIPQVIVQSQLRGGQTTSALRLIMRSSKTGRKTLIVASAVWHVAAFC